MFKKFSRDDDNLVEGYFKCDSQMNLISALRSFIDVKGFQVDGLRTGNLLDICEGLFHNMNERFPDRLKYFLFDDAEVSTDVIHCIDYKMFRPLLQLPEDDIVRKTWKIVVTTQKEPQVWLNSYNNPELTTGDFVSVTGFSDDEIVDFLFRSERARSLTDDDIDTIKDKFGRKPLMLKALRKEIESDLVSVMIRGPLDQ